jgi:small multidrug resistance pump
VKSRLYLLLAVVAEVIATSALKSSDGFTRLSPSIVVVCSYAIAFYFLSLAIRAIPIGIAYAIWSGIGLTLISLVGWLMFDQRLDPAAIFGIGLIMGGVLVLNLFSTVGTHP